LNIEFSNLGVVGREFARLFPLDTTKGRLKVPFSFVSINRLKEQPGETP
jgi:hypothetical protein